MKNWFQNILEGSIYQGLEIFEADDSIHFSLLKVNKKKGELHTVFEAVFRSVEEMVLHSNKKQALLLAINSAKVLKKQVSVDPKMNLEQCVIRAFPNLDLENFFYEVLEVNGLGVVSIAKKEHVNQLLAELKVHGIFPTKISLGISDLQNTVPFLKESNIAGSNFQLHTLNGSLVEFEPKDSIQQDSIELNGLTLSASSLLSFSGILGYLNRTHQKSNINRLNLQFENGFKNSRFFDVGLKVGLGVMLSALLINFLLFTSYREKAQSMDTISSSEQQLVMLKTLKDRVESKEERLNALLGSSNSRATFYLDRIAHGLPNSVQLDQMEYQPLLKPVRDGKLIGLDQNSVQISGISNDKVEFAQWIEVLEQKDWMGKIEILGYGYCYRLSIDK